MFALNQGEVCTCPSRALVQQGHYREFLADAVERTQQVTQGHPLDTATMIGAQASNDQLEKILSYLDIGRAIEVLVFAVTPVDVVGKDARVGHARSGLRVHRRWCKSR